jgi:hypothetical protein
MPAVAIKLRKLSGWRDGQRFPRGGQMDLSEYLQALSALQPGDVGAMELGDLTSPAAKPRVGLSAAQLGVRVRWARPIDSHSVYFPVLGAPQRARILAGTPGPRATRRAPSGRSVASVSGATAVPETETARPKPKGRTKRMPDPMRVEGRASRLRRQFRMNCGQCAARDPPMVSGLLASSLAACLYVARVSVDRLTARKGRLASAGSRHIRPNTSVAVSSGGHSWTARRSARSTAATDNYPRGRGRPCP